MNIQQRTSGLLVATEKPPQPVPPPEHRVCADIRESLNTLCEALSHYEQTTHGHLGTRDIEGVARALVEAYRSPGAYTISNLSQSIRHLGK